jgi:tetratricopeptide (TPR) repeat protein
MRRALVLVSIAMTLPSAVQAEGSASAPRPAPASKAIGLGRISFPTSGPQAAKLHFLRGMLALHSFWYEEARDEFREATRAAPDFAMGYWGEAMSYFHPVWAEEDVAASRAALQRIPAGAVGPRLTKREQMYIDAARTLVADGDRATRWQRYADTMGELRARFPKDDEAATLHAVALLGTAFGQRFVDGKEPRFRVFAEAAALAADVLARNPSHPGAAHYLIHSFDDPEHAVLALPAARSYARIAPEASHAQHMPSHIFVQLGMWSDASKSNEAAWGASDAWVRRKGLDVSHHDFHSLSWLQSIRLEQGRRRQAAAALDLARRDLGAAREKRSRLRVIYAQMVADFLSETDDWARADDLLAPLANPEPGTSSALIAASESTAPAAAASCHSAAADNRADAHNEALTLAFVRGLRALAQKDAAGADAAANTLAKLIPSTVGVERDFWQTAELEIRGRAAAVRGNVEAAIAKLKTAIEIDERRPPLGPVQGVTPRERLADLLLAKGRASEALQNYKRVLELHPRRARALLGMARAAAAVRDPAAPSYWSELATVWSDADQELPDVVEVRRATMQEQSRVQ